MENNKVFEIIYDVLEEHIRPELKRIALSGGTWCYGSRTGLCYWWSCNGDSAIGARLNEDKMCFKIFNEKLNLCELYNIIVKFNDDDEITHVEYINDSKCVAFDKNFMYSIYEDLKKYEIESEAVDTGVTERRLSKTKELVDSGLITMPAPIVFDMDQYELGGTYHISAPPDSSYEAILVDMEPTCLTFVTYNNFKYLYADDPVEKIKIYPSQCIDSTGLMNNIVITRLIRDEKPK